MAAVHNQVWNQYLSIIKAEKSVARLPEAAPRGLAPVRSSDAQASKPAPPLKGRYVDIMV